MSSPSPGVSRRTTQDVDELLLVSDHTVKGVRTIARIIELVDELELIVKRQSVIINQVPDGLDPMVAEELQRLKIKPTATIPLDEELVKYDIQMKPLLELPDNSKAVKAIGDLMINLLGIKEAK